MRLRGIIGAMLAVCLPVAVCGGSAAEAKAAAEKGDAAAQFRYAERPRTEPV